MTNDQLELTQAFNKLYITPNTKGVSIITYNCDSCDATTVTSIKLSLEETMKLKRYLEDVLYAT